MGGLYMKEIKYDGDLSKNIKIYNKFKSDFKFILLSLLVFFNMAIAICIASTIFPNNLIVVLVTFFIYYLVDKKIFTHYTSKYNDSFEDLSKVAYQIEKLTDFNVNVTDKELAKAKIIQSEMLKQTSSINVEKNVNYFQVLDKKNQIQILKHIKTIVNENQTNNKLFLLEEKDLEKEHIYIKK